MRFRCTEKAKYAQMFDQHREIGRATKGHPQPKGLIRRKGILDETPDVSDLDDDWSDWDGSDGDEPEEAPEETQEAPQEDAQEIPHVPSRVNAPAESDEDEYRPGAGGVGSDDDESGNDDKDDDSAGTRTTSERLER